MGVECNKDRSSDNAVGYRKIYHNKRTPAARHTSFLFMLASEQVRLAGGKRLEVNTYEMARQSRKAETKDSENEVELKMKSGFIWSELLHFGLLNYHHFFIVDFYLNAESR